MIPTHLLRALALPLLVAASAQAAAIVVTDFSGSYNPANKLPSTAPGSSSTVAGFTSAVATAFTNGNGAVWGFNNASGSYVPSTSAADTWTLAFATNKLLTVSPSIRMRYNNFGSAGSTSTGASDILSGFSNETSYTLNLALSGSAVGVNEKVTQIGFAVLNRNTGSTPVYTVTAKLDDNSTIVLTDTVSVGTVDTDNTHFGIVATAGRYITGVTISATNSQPAIIDDFGFITGNVSPVPEPATFATLAGILTLGTAAYRRRRS